MVNDYSDTWYTTFLKPIPASQTKAETAFIVRNVPAPQFYSLVDLGCGSGRHAQLLARRGYRVLGLDNNPAIIEKAKQLSDPALDYLCLDLRRLADLPQQFDAALSLWQSFGYFDETANQNLLRQIQQKLTPKGRFILDVYNREFFERNQGTRQIEKDGVSITEHQHLSGNRLQVALTYAHTGQKDEFDWQIYYPNELVQRVKALGFQCLVACTGFEERQWPSADQPRMQFVFEKR